LRLVEKARNAFLDFEVPVTMIETHSAKLPLKLSILRDDYCLTTAAILPQRSRKTPESSPRILIVEPMFNFRITKSTPPGLPRWFTGLCTTRISIETQLRELKDCHVSGPPLAAGAFKSL
jgi:hypothetical protein